MALLPLIACGSGGTSDVGKTCTYNLYLADGGVVSTLIGAPSAQCNSMMCLVTPNPSTPAVPRHVCTARCASDADCAGANLGARADGSCPSSFACVVAQSAGTFACNQVCVCQDDLVVGFNVDNKGQTILPAGCPLPH